MEYIYIALVDTPGIFASIIRKVIKINYIHVVLSLDENLTNAYSVGRRNPAIPYFSGFEKEDTEKILRAYPSARYMITKIECSKEQKDRIEQELHNMYGKCLKYHYCVLGLPFILFNKPFYQKNHYTCSSY